MQKSLQCLLLGNNAERSVKPRLAGPSGQKDGGQISVPKIISPMQRRWHMKWWDQWERNACGAVVLGDSF